jgi:hypothetical protein
MRDSFSETELQHFRGLADRFKLSEPIRRVLNEPRESAPPILLTARELEADPQLRRPDEGVPHPYPHGLRDLAENSRALYLADKPEPQTSNS